MAETTEAPMTEEVVNPFEIPLPLADATELTAEQDRQGPVLVAGSAVCGVSTWAKLLNLEEVSVEESECRSVLLVARSTESSLVQTLELIAEYRDTDRVIAGILVVPDAPGKPAKSIQHRITILAGAHPLLQVPWVPALRGVVLDEDLVQQKNVAKACAQVRAWVDSHTVVSLPN